MTLYPICPLIKGLGDLLDAVIEHLPELEVQDEDEGRYWDCCALGKPNVGKSSIVNRLLEARERVIVSDIPGTTRDAIDTPFVVNGQKYVCLILLVLGRRALE